MDPLCFHHEFYSFLESIDDFLFNICFWRQKNLYGLQLFHCIYTAIICSVLNTYPMLVKVWGYTYPFLTDWLHSIRCRSSWLFKIEWETYLLQFTQNVTRNLSLLKGQPSSKSLNQTSRLHVCPSVHVHVTIQHFITLRAPNASIILHIDFSFETMKRS